MKYIIFFIFLLLSLTGCGSSGDKIGNKAEQISDPTIQSQTQSISTLASTTSDTTLDTKKKEEISLKQEESSKVITIYIHGFDPKGYKREGIYGNDDYLEENAKVANFMGFSTMYEESNSDIGNNLLLSTPYYGNKTPDYYTDQDIKDIENIGVGIPRYALIVAKYAKHAMEINNAQRVNFLSVSMGSLVTRYLIEKNLENMASNKQIKKWLSIEGVIRGNYAASNKNLVKLVDLFEKQSPDVEHMSYQWIEANLGDPAIGNSPYYKDIIIGFETSTKDNALDGILSAWLLLNDKFRPNDGYQVARDTYFKIDDTDKRFNLLEPTHTYFHDNHIDLANNKSAWVEAVSFLTSKKRVKITLTKATINDIHEDKSKIKIMGITAGSHDFRPAEVVFSSSIVSPKINDLWSVETPIDERALSGGALPIHKYQSNGETKIVNQELFNDFIVSSEDILKLNLNAYEIDQYLKYNMYELTGKKTENLGAGTINLPIKNGTYQLSTEDWNAEIKVEVFEY